MDENGMKSLQVGDAMKRKRLGRTALEVSEMGFGCSRLGRALGGVRLSRALGGADEPEITATLLSAWEQGVNFFDTADSYGQGQSERTLGKVFSGKRDQVILASKAGYSFSPLRRLASRLPLLKPLAGSRSHQNFAPDYISKSVEGSLRRLQTDYLDLFLLHSPPVNVLRHREWVETLENLKQQGKIRYCGVSCLTPSDALFCLEVPELDCVQLEINLLNREETNPLLAQLAERKLGIVARQPFASGALTQPDEKRREALTFVLQQPGIASVLVGMRHRQHLQDNLALIAQCSSKTGDGDS